MNILLRRARKDKTTCEGIANVSTAGLTAHRADRRWPIADGYIFRWGCTSPTPIRETVMAVEVNTPAAISWCNNKRQSRLDMQSAGVSVPKTWSVEKYGDIVDLPTVFDRNVTDGKLYVGRKITHTRGRDLVHGYWYEVEDQVRSWCGGYISELINKVAEYRVMVVCNRVAWVAKKTPGNPEDVAWNVDQGGRFDNVRWGEWPMAVVKEALKAMAVGSVDFGGVDVMVDADGKEYVLEINSAPSHESEYRTSCTAKCFDYITINGKEHFPEPEKFRSWKNIIHPALWTREE